VSTEGSGRIKVLVVDDRKLLAEAVGLIIMTDPSIHVAGVDTDPMAAVAQARSAQPDVLLVDFFMLTRRGGDHIAAALRSEMPGIKILVLTQHQDDATLLACVEAGAAGCVTKDSPPAGLIDAIKRVHAGKVLYAPDALVKLLARRPGRRRRYRRWRRARRKSCDWRRPAPRCKG
jgi:DNA-binding NarL/FixJ family response regulator